MRCFTAVESRERFEARVVIVPNGCHIWTGCVTGHGYGTLVRDQKQWKAHRFAWTLYRGPIPEGMHVLHHCDVPPCVNPEHLWLGTHTENIQDMDRKGRRARSGNAKLSDDEVRSIRESGHESRPMLARRHSVSISTISKVRGHQTYRGVN